MATPPLDRWAEDEALRELARLARDLPEVDAAEAWRRLDRLTQGQRDAVVAAVKTEAERGPGSLTFLALEHRRVVRVASRHHAAVVAHDGEAQR